MTTPPLLIVSTLRKQNQNFFSPSFSFKKRTILDWRSLHPFSTLLMFESLISIPVLFSSRTSHLQRAWQIDTRPISFGHLLQPKLASTGRPSSLKSDFSPRIRVAKNVKTLKAGPFCGLKCVLCAILFICKPAIHFGMWDLPKTTLDLVNLGLQSTVCNIYGVTTLCYISTSR